MPEPAALQQAINLLANRQPLTESQAAAAFNVVMSGGATPVQIASLLMGLRVKGETAEEVAGVARALREAMVRVEADGPHLVDTCGTGGGTVTTFNISTAAAFVAAGAGATVAKHGNRSYTSKCGSADVLESLGVAITLEAARAEQVLREAGMAFLFAPTFHPAMRHVAPVRRELGVTTVMNLVGPLANPAGVRRQVIGVADRDRAPLMAAAVARLGAEHALVVHGRVGMDEISPQGTTDVWEIRDGAITHWELEPRAFGIEAEAALLCGGEPGANAARLEDILRADEGSDDQAGRGAVLLNAGAAIYVSGLARTYREGIERAATALRAKRWSGCGGRAPLPTPPSPRLVLPDDADDDALHDDVALVYADRSHRRVRRLQPDPATGLAIVPLHRRVLAMNQRDDRRAVVGLIPLMDDHEIAVLDVLVDHGRAAHFEHIAPATTREQLVGYGDRIGPADCFDRLAGRDQPEERELGGAGLALGGNDLDGPALVVSAPDVPFALEIGEVLVHGGERLEPEALGDFLEARGIALVPDVALEVVQDLALAPSERHLVSRK